MGDRLADSRIKCSLFWKLCRRHGWGSPVPEDALVDMALARVEQGRGKKLVKELRTESYIEHQEGKGYKVKNSPDEQAKAAFRLRDTCSYSELRIEATLSRFEQAGGFDTYGEGDVFDPENDDW